MMKKFTFHFHQVLTALLTIAAFAVGQSAWAAPHAHSGSTTHTSLSVAPDDECTHEYEWIEIY